MPELSLREDQVPPEPLALFAEWYSAAVQTPMTEPGAMTLATATAGGAPDGRVVLLRGFDERGFVFFTNYASRKAAELAENPRAVLVFYWPPFPRQVRIEGGVEKVTAQESDVYFHSRPLGHCLSTLVSSQSQVVPSRQYLEERLAELNQRYDKASAVPRPEHWGGYRVRPEQIEFWQGRANRLHDRLRYRRGGAQEWILERLAP
jgi:pyridoxamine 5'-phosphate oxidase